MVSTSGSRRRSTTFEALTNPCSSAIIMIFSHTSLTYQARARDHAGSLANFGSLIHSGICITPPDKKSDGGAQSLKAGYGIIRWRVGFSLHFSKDLARDESGVPTRPSDVASNLTDRGIRRLGRSQVPSL